MKVDRIEFEELYPIGSFANQRYRASATITDEDDITQCYLKLADHVEKAFIAKNPQINWSDSTRWTAPPQEAHVLPTSIQPPKESAIESYIKTINACETLPNLKMFEKLVKNTNDDSLSIAYSKKHEELYKQKSVTS